MIMENFITILAWIFGVLAGGFTILRVVGYCTYPDIERLKDRMSGKEVSFSVSIPGSITIICIAWVLSH